MTHICSTNTAFHTVVPIGHAVASKGEFFSVCMSGVKKHIGIQKIGIGYGRTRSYIYIKR